MTVLLFANNAVTTLAAPLSNSATTATLASGTGALFPVPSTNQAFKMTFKDAATQLVVEIVLVTGMSGDTITSMVRGQEGTTPQAYATGDFAGNFNTAGAQQAFYQNYTQLNNLTNAATITTPNLELFQNANAAPIVQTVPAGATLAANYPGRVRLKFWKTDASANAVTPTLTSPDTFCGPFSPDNSFPIETQGSSLEIEWNGSLNQWMIL